VAKPLGRGGGGAQGDVQRRSTDSMTKEGYTKRESEKKERLRVGCHRHGEKAEKLSGGV